MINSIKYRKPVNLFLRHTGNPIITPDQWPYLCNATFNPGAVRNNGETLLLVRVEDMRGFSHLTFARSKDGKSGWQVDETPTLKPDPENNEGCVPW